MNLFKLIRNDNARRIYSSSIIIFLFSVIACKKDPAIPLPNECLEIPPFSGTGFGYSYSVDTNYFLMPYFNPNNEDEFLFVKKNNATGNSDLYIYNLQNNSKQNIYSGNIIFPPKWGKNGWILINLSDANIYKIKNNGDSLTQLTTSSNLYYPEWNNLSEKFIVADGQIINTSYILDENGNFLDTLSFDFSSTGSWQDENLIVSHEYSKITFYDLDSQTIIQEYNYWHELSLWGSVMWLNQNDIIWSNDRGLNKLSLDNISNNFKSSCNSKQYLFGSINSSKTKMIWQRIDKELINSDLIGVKSRIFIMDVDGRNEREILFD